MHLSNFFRISWLIQLLVGLGLFAVSFMLESEVLQKFIAVPLLAILLAAALETGKAVSIVWHRYLSAQPRHLYPRSIQLASSGFRIGLVGLSALCSLLFLAGHLDRPLLKQIRTEDISLVSQWREGELKRLDNEQAARRKQLLERQQQEYADVRKSFDQRLRELETDLKAEMDNVVNGQFKGPRYDEIETQIKNTRQEREAALSKLAETHQQQIAHLDAELQTYYDGERTRVQDEAERRRQTLTDKDYATDERVHDPQISAFLKVLESVFTWTIQPLQFVFVFSLLLAGLMEIGILLAFGIITVAILPAVRVQHEQTLRNEMQGAQINGEMQRDAAEHEAALNRIRQSADRVMQKANEYMSAT